MTDTTTTVPLRRGARPCCGGYGECFEWCTSGQLETDLRHRGVPFNECDTCGGLIDPDDTVRCYSSTDGRRWHPGNCFASDDDPIYAGDGR